MKLLLRPLLVVVATLAIATCAMAAQSSQPQEPPKASSAASNQQPAYPPVNITVAAAEPDPEKEKREEARDDRNVAAQEDIRDFTRILTVLAFVQFLITGGGLIYAARAASAAKVSADVARDALYLFEAPDIRIQQGDMHRTELFVWAHEPQARSRAWRRALEGVGWYVASESTPTR